ncbi:RNA polymerase sigma-I factor [Psychrobacillus psychrodurans]|uniref:RNA polymerase sigma factor SigI n=1 Tax=Psychrobacillus psychrodurans TaxID=126157 RepID=A0A9X3R7Z9_9BACI|nr:RNA polymerase sigma-I factor [Psychrobacillus psychrodurans]MCZ8532050.1 RNA polymerase sigma-I factor [Psychrobacillus psychrodurans]
MLLSIVQGLFKTKPKQNMQELITKAQAGDKEVLNDLLLAHTLFLKKTASFICKRTIDEQDEEFSIALNGCHEAINAYNPTENASFQTFAHLVIKRRITDFIRKEAVRHKKELLFDGSENNSEDEHFLLKQHAVTTYSEEQYTESRREELIKYSKLLTSFNLSFDELTKSAPKHKDARKTAFQIAQIIADSEELYELLIKTKKLPLREIEALVEVSRKTLERQRKYIIAVVLLLNSDFVYIKDYVKGEII